MQVLSVEECITTASSTVCTTTQENPLITFDPAITVVLSALLFFLAAYTIRYAFYR